MIMILIATIYKCPTKMHKKPQTHSLHLNDIIFLQWRHKKLIFTLLKKWGHGFQDLTTKELIHII